MLAMQWTIVVVLRGSVWICVCGCAAWIRWCAGVPDAHDPVDPLSAAVGAERPHAHDVVDPLSAAVGVDGTLVVVLHGSVWICVRGCTAWIQWCAREVQMHMI